jgi:glycine/D-amino acid oxidase-like deaminating enzyme
MKYFSPVYAKRDGLRPPELYEYFVDNFWFESAGLESEKINEPLRGSHKADIVIIGGGYTGLSTAFNIHRRFPEKKITLLEGACCGYGASGRNGGFCVGTSLLDDECLPDPEARKNCLEVSLYGLSQIKQFISDFGLDCDFEENGMLDVAFDERQTLLLKERHEHYKKWDIESTLLEGSAVQEEIRSPRCAAALTMPLGATLNPAKLVRGMKKIVENMGVEIRERSVVTRVVPGVAHHVDTELGDVEAPVLVVATNAYSHKIGFFRNRVFPLCTFIVATEPLTQSQWEAIGWQNRQGLCDCRTLFNYAIPSADGRIIIGGSDVKYYPNDGLSTGNNKSVTRLLVGDLVKTFPPLEGIRVDHAWGGTTAGSRGLRLSVGVLGEHKNVYYGLGYGEGVPSTQAAGRIIADLMAGERNAFTTHPIVNCEIPYAGPTALRSFFAAMAKWYAVNVVKTWKG